MKTKAEQEPDKAKVEEVNAADSPDVPIKELDETVPGGRYKRGDEYVNAHGETVK